MVDAHEKDHAITGEGAPVDRVPPQVFISYAQEDREHRKRVRDFWVFLRTQCGIDAHLDALAAEQRVDWALWMTREVRDSDRILVIASPEYKKRAEGDAKPTEGRGVQWEARLIRELLHADPEAGLRRILPVVLPGCSATDIPLWLGPATTTYYTVTDYTVAGAKRLLRQLTDQPGLIEPPLGPLVTLPPDDLDAPPGSPAAPTRPTRAPLHTEVVIEADLSAGGMLDSAVWVGGTLLSRTRAPLPPEVSEGRSVSRLPTPAAEERVVTAGRKLAQALLEPDDQALLAELLNRLAPGDTAEVVLSAAGKALTLPVELTRLCAGEAGEVGPLGLLAGVSVSRRPAAPGRELGDRQPPPSPRPATGLAGPLKILAVVAAPDETKTDNDPLDTEAQMAAMLDAVTDMAAAPNAQVRILEVASLPMIRQALAHDAYHVLHLFAHGSPDSVELENEDGDPVGVTTAELMQAVKHAGRPVPLIMLSSCSTAATGTEAMAAGLVGRGADRVIAMLSPVTEDYATALARRFYRELSADPKLSVGQALTKARYLAEEGRSRTKDDRRLPPEYGVPTLLAASGDGPLVDPTAPSAPLPVVTTPPTGKLVLDMPMGMLIGRRAQMRTAMNVLRHAERAVDEFGATGGVILTGVGGIGKTAVAGRLISRLRDDGWLVAVHEGRWNPTALITGTASALAQALPQMPGNGRTNALRDALARLADPHSDDGPKLDVVAALLRGHNLLVVFDDFEQNLTSSGDAFLDPTIDQAVTALADSADTGALLVTCRYPLPGRDRDLARIPIPPLSPAELRRLFLRLPKLRELDVEDRRLLIRTIGGHPRLIEFTDALLRGGRANLRYVQKKLRDLADAEQIDLSQDRPLEAALDQAMLLGSADILLTELVGLLTPSQTEVLHQVAVCRAPMTLDDLAFALSSGPGPDGSTATVTQPPSPELRADVNRLTDLTLLTAGDLITMHPWTAALVTRNTQNDLTAQHERALAMRLRRFERDRGTYDDLIDIPRHLAALKRYDDIAALANQATQIPLGTLAIVACLAEIRPLIPQVERSWILVADLEVQALLRAGDLTAAATQYRAIHQQVEKRAAADPANAEWQRDLSVSHNKLGDLARAAGDLTTARTNYQASLGIRQRLAATDPANTEWQRDLSVSHERLGNIAQAAGDLTAARTAYQAALDIAQRLAAADPANTEWQRDLSVSHNNLGDLAQAAGDLTTARTAHQAALDIWQRLAATDPANTQWQRDLSISHERLGDLAQAAGDLTTARTAHQTSLDIAERLAATDPANTEWQRDLSVSHNNLGDLAQAAGDLTTARTNYQAALDIWQRLAATDPANTQWQRDLSISHERLGDLAWAAGDLTTARTSYQAALDIRERLTATDPTNTQWQRDWEALRQKIEDLPSE